MEKTIKIFFADDHPVFREGLIKIIEQDKSLKVIGTSGNGLEALEIITKQKPNIAVLDISMPGLSGLEITKKITSSCLPTIPIILTMYEEEEYFDEAMEFGVMGYILKDSTVKEILDCIKIVLQGGLYVSKELTEKFLRNRVRKTGNDFLKTKLECLTQTERQILKMLSQNKTSLQIAEEMFISFRTVQNHRNNIANKLELKGYNKLLLFAIENKNLLQC